MNTALRRFPLFLPTMMSDQSPNAIAAAKAGFSERTARRQRQRHDQRPATLDRGPPAAGQDARQLEGDWLLDAGSPEIHKLAVVFDAVVFDRKRRLMRSTYCASAATEMRSSHQGALPLPLSQPAVSETHAKASGMWDNLLHRRITKLSIIVGPDAQRTRDNRSNQR